MIKKPDILNDLGYQALEISENTGWAVTLFKLNTELFPQEGNVWDSLGEGYVNNEQKEEAIKRHWNYHLESIAIGVRNQLKH